jgi:hypothetical protein
MTERQTYFLLTVVACGLSIGAIPVAAYLTKNAADGGRGGALAVALSFAMLFLNRDLGTKIFKILTRKPTAPTPDGSDFLAGAKTAEEKTERLAVRVLAWEGKLNTDALGQSRQNKFLAVMSIVGTLAWGFGDMAACHLIQSCR